MCEDMKQEQCEVKPPTETDAIIDELSNAIETLNIIRANLSDNLSRIVGEEVTDDKVEAERPIPATQLSKISELIYKIRMTNRDILKDTRRLEQI